MPLSDIFSLHFVGNPSMRSIRSLTRFQATAGHVVISLIVGLIVLSTMLLVWFPSPLFQAMGGAELLFLIVGVDVVIGPLITLIIFNPKKKLLLIDLSVIALLQMAALGYGVFAMYSGRPVYIVATDVDFKIVSASELDPVDIAEARLDEYKTLSLTGPRLVGTRVPDTPAERLSMSNASAFGVGVESFPKYYVPYIEVRSALLGVAKPVAQLDLSAEDSEVLADYLRKTSRQGGDIRCLPVGAKLRPLTAVISAKDGAFLALLPISLAFK